MGHVQRFSDETFSSTVHSAYMHSLGTKKILAYKRSVLINEARPTKRV